VKLALMGLLAQCLDPQAQLEAEDPQAALVLLVLLDPLVQQEPLV
jgi:hypothetical protein